MILMKTGKIINNDILKIVHTTKIRLAMTNS